MNDSSTTPPLLRPSPNTVENETENFLLPKQREVESLFVSDLHLGCKHSQPENFLHFLESVAPKQLFILGDFLDGWKLKASWRWKPVYNKIANRLFALAQSGTQLFYTPGNHDAFLRCPDVQNLVRSAGIKIRIEDEFIFKSASGDRYLLTHGDRFDLVEMKYQWLSMATSVVYEPLLSFNWWSHWALRRKATSPYAACAVLKDRVKAAVRFISRFERSLFDYAKLRGCQGVICGHIHSPRVLRAEGMLYVNIGDWVENCTAMVEHVDGSLCLESYFPHVPDQVIRSRPSWHAGEGIEESNCLDPLEPPLKEEVVGIA